MTNVLHPTTLLPMNIRLSPSILLAQFIACLLFLAGGIASLHALTQTSGTNADGYTWTSDGISVTITGGTLGMTNLMIPSSINGLPVVCIGTNAFNDSTKYSNITTICLPDTVQSIRDNSFSGCLYVNYLTIPDSVSNFGYCCFGIGYGEMVLYNSLYSNKYVPYRWVATLEWISSHPIPKSLVSLNASAQMKSFLNQNADILGIRCYGNLFQNPDGWIPYDFGPQLAPVNINQTMSFSDADFSVIATNTTFLNALTTAVTNQSNIYGILRQGSNGINGTNGATGPQGAQGPAGPQGPIGLTGPEGAVGPQGPKGDKGDTGAQGPMGLTGPQGTAGLNGTNGATGTFDPTVLTNTAFLNGLATNQAFIQAMTTNPAFLAAIAQGIAGSTNNYGFYLKQSQTLNFPAIAPMTFSYGKTLKLTVTSSAKLTPVTYTSSNDGVALASSNALTITGAGTVTIRAAQAGNLTTAPATASQVFVVTPVVQTLKFSAITAQAYASGKTVTLNATSSAKLSPITYTSSNEGVATVSNNVLTLQGPGTSVITATQAGDGNNTSASAVQILTVK